MPVYQRMRMRNAAALCAVALLASLVCVGKAAHAAPPGTLREVVFSEYSPLSGNAELARRILSPLAAARVSEMLAESGKQMRDQPIDLSGEKFAVYVPQRVPGAGYALLVFVPPWNDARLPDGWAPVLDQEGVVFVAAARSGNDQNVLGRRMPLALLAEQNAASRYRIDPQRVFVAGFSGGSRVALRLALAYPDIFHGAILNAGSDQIGSARIPLPPRELFLQFQQSTHLVYVTGDGDMFHLAADLASIRSMEAWCVIGVEDQTAPFADHEVIGSAALSRALEALFHPVSPEAAKLDGCRAAIDAELTARLAQVRTLIAGGERNSARQLLQDTDARYGGLAAPGSTELAKALGGAGDP